MNLKLSVLFLLATSPLLQSQQNAPAQPATPAATTPAISSGIAAMSPDELRVQLTKDEARLKDWPALSRYRDANAKLLPPSPTENRIVFMGDSITDNWAKRPASFFPGKNYIGRGIGGQTTPQLLIRFRPDVIALHPKVVVLLAGTNDIAGNTSPSTDEDIENNIASMGDLALQNGIRLVISSILPTCEKQLAHRPIERILLLNDWLKSYAAAHHFTYLDYYPAMLDNETNELRRGLTADCLHPNAEGYKIMVPLAEDAVKASLAQPLPSETKARTSIQHKTSSTVVPH